QYIQAVLGYTPLQAGVRIIPVAGGMILGAGLSTKLTRRFGTKVMVAAGLGTVSAALFLLAHAQVDSGYGLVAAVLAIMGLGMGFAMAPAPASVMGWLLPEEAGVGSAMNGTTRVAGGWPGCAAPVC